jgi:hypothetical protein
MALKSWAMPFCEMRNLSNGPGFWKLSGSGTNEYYLRYPYDALALPVDNILSVKQEIPYGVPYLLSSLQYDSGTPGALDAGNYGIGNNDNLYMNTLYIRLKDDSNPNNLDYTQRLIAGAGIMNGTSSWTQSSASTNEYYFNSPIQVQELVNCLYAEGMNFPSSMTPGTVGTLEPGQFGLALSDPTDAESLTLFVRMPADADPDNFTLMISFDLHGGDADPDYTWVASDAFMDDYLLLWKYEATDGAPTPAISEEPQLLLLNGSILPKSSNPFSISPENPSRYYSNIAQNEWAYGGRMVDGSSYENLYIRLKNEFNPNYLKKDLIQIPQYNVLVDNTDFSQCVIIDTLFINKDSRNAQVHVRIVDSDSSERFAFTVDVNAGSTHHIDRKIILNAGDKLLVQSTTEFMSVYANGDQS